MYSMQRKGRTFILKNHTLELIFHESLGIWKAVLFTKRKTRGVDEEEFYESSVKRVIAEVRGHIARRENKIVAKVTQRMKKDEYDGYDSVIPTHDFSEDNDGGYF
jgi:hypothetical protein